MTRKKKPDEWAKLMTLIEEYADALRADEMKGGGDPLAIPEIEAQLELARVRLEVHVKRMSTGEEQ